jgi:hypothetical protein
MNDDVLRSFEVWSTRGMRGSSPTCEHLPYDSFRVSEKGQFVRDLVAELERAIRDKILSELTSSSGDPELNSKDLRELLLIYGNWRSRLISSRARQVHRSSEISANPKATQYVAALDAIESDIRAGADT